MCKVSSYRFGEDNGIPADVVDQYISENRAGFYHNERGTERLQTAADEHGEPECFQSAIDSGVRDQLDDYSDRYDIWFEAPDQLIEEINRIETKNLDLVLQSQESDHQLQEWKKKTESLVAAKNDKIEALNDACEGLRQKIRQENQALFLMSRERAGKESTVALENFDRVKAKVIGLYSSLKGEFDKNSLRHIKSKGEVDNQALLNILLEVEKLYYRYIKGFKKDTMGGILKTVG